MRRKSNYKLIKMKGGIKNKSRTNKKKMKHKKTKKINKRKEKIKLKSFIKNPVVITLIVVYFLITFLYIKQFPYEKNIEKEMLNDGEKLLENVITNEIRPFNEARDFQDIIFVIKDEIDVQRLKRFAELSYDEIKRSLKIDNDFCIHFEDLNGNLIDISGITGNRGIGIGSQDIYFEVLDEHGNVIDTLRCS